MVIEDTHQRGLRRILDAVRDAGGTARLPARHRARRRAAGREAPDGIPRSDRLTLAELVEPHLAAELDRSLTRQRVQQYQRYFSDADRVLILTHNDPDPDAMASGLALRNLLRRTKQTAIIGAMQRVTRPENQRMLKLLEIGVETVTADQFAEFDKIALVDVQPHYFGDTLPHVDLVVDHHPESPATPRSSRTSAPTTARPAPS